MPSHPAPEPDELRRIIENSPDAIARFDRELRYVYANRVIIDAAGMPFDDIVGMSLFDVMPESELAEQRAVTIRQVFATGEPMDGDWALETLAGPRFYQSRLMPEFDAAGNVATVLVVSRDNTERVLAERALLASEERFRHAFDVLPVGVVIGADGGELLHANPAFERMTGYSIDELVEIGILGVTFPDDREQDRERASALVAGGVDKTEYEKRYLHRNGSVVWARLQLSLLGTLPDGRRTYLGHAQDITAQKRIEAELRERDEQLQRAFDAVAIGMSIVALDGHFMRVNRALCTMLGMEPEALLATTFHAITHPDDLDADLREVDRMLRGEVSSLVMEKRYLTASGAPLWVLLTASLVHDERGEPLYFVSQIQDIEARKAAEEALRFSDARFETVFEEAAIGMALLTTDGRFLRANRALQALLGYDASEITQLTSFDVTHPDDVAADLASVAEIAAGGVRSINREKRYLTKDGRVIWVQLSSAVVVDDAGRPRYLVAQLQDISARRRAEQERERLLHETESARGQLRGVVDAVGDAIIFVGADARILMTNEQFDELFGVRSETFVRRTLEGVRDIAATVFGTTAAYDDLIVPLVGDEARKIVAPLHQRWPVERELELGSVPVRAGSGEFLGRLYTFRDVTREREVDRMKTEFVSLVSHELRTPLTSIAGYVDLMLEGETGELTDDQRQFLEIVGNNASRLVALINDLLDISRIEAGKVELRREALRLADVVEPVVASFRPQVEARGQQVSLDVPLDLPLVLADEQRLAQIVTNLVSNAHKYTPDGGSIAIRAARDGAQLALQVSDTGIGMSEAELAQLYTRFFRATNETTRATGGTGLGLAITRSLVEMHGGEIHVASAPGVGSRFTVSLPIVDG